MDLLQLLDRSISFQRPFVKLTGSVTGALLLSQALYWQLRCKSEDGWWWKTQAEWEEETGMTRSELESARAKCAEFLHYKRRGVPAKGYYQLNQKALQTRLQESCKLDCGKPANKTEGIPQSSNGKSTSESTSPITADSGSPSSSPKAPPPEHKIFIEAWTTEFLAHWGRHYVFQGGKDGSAVKRLLMASKLNSAQLIAIAKAAWGKSGREYWACEHARTIAAFASQINEIQAELQQKVQCMDPNSQKTNQNHEYVRGLNIVGNRNGK